MHHNIQYNQKLSQVIQLALNYKNHRKSLSSIKPVLKIPSINKMQRNQSLKNNQIKYMHESKHSKQVEIQNINRSQTSRIRNVKSTLKSIYSPQSHRISNTSEYKTIPNPEHKQTLNSQHQADHSPQNRNKQSSKRLNSRISQRPASNHSVSSNFGGRSRRLKQIERQNKKIAQRIQNPKMQKQLNNKYFDKQFIKQQEYLRIRSRFSQRSKSIIQSLTLDGLKMSKKDLGFLPQIESYTNRTKIKEIPNIASSKSREFTSINQSRSSQYRNTVNHQSKKKNTHQHGLKDTHQHGLKETYQQGTKYKHPQNTKKNNQHATKINNAEQTESRTIKFLDNIPKGYKKDRYLI